MKNLLLAKLIFLLVFISACETVKKKSNEAVEKENKKLSKFIGQPESELKIVMGNPTEESKNEKGSRILVYKNKKYGILCERQFEINEFDMVVGFISKGCF